ncbi:DUF721 domain-containing protein [Candidatus Dojkabacteria bacterium]|uniref:DUF721 domain-containing protein n=1 Tax=Candidatus Dojkabacteria bacterium TaxID=2099670 RepID=A0A5C7J6W5_9BACT|nr:MAG: DUF721 domain-containing protein [Candidatus Dojkabacteria bacterium]
MRSMKHLFQIQQEKKSSQPSVNHESGVMDEKTIFFLFERIVGEYYGQRGRKVIHPMKYQEKILTVKVASPLWANELLIQEQALCERLNQEVGREVLQGVRVLHGLSADR